MDTAIYLYLPVLFTVVSLSSGDTYSVKISTEHVNLIDSRFMSFTIDPKYLFSTSEKYSSKDCICMATSLTPAYLRIAGPSTSHMSFRNTTISINDLDFDMRREDLEVMAVDVDAPRKVPLEVMTKKLAVTHREWRKFVHWAKSNGFDLVFALNNEERTASGMWDPNTALNILTVAEKARIGDMFWELGYECSNQSIEEYLNDLETLRVIIETFPPGRMGEWMVVGGDVTKCLQADSKNDFKDYITLSNDMMDALLLNGKSTSHELDRMTENDRMKLWRLLSHSKTPLWLTENNQRRYTQWERAADWLASLGYSAKNGFSVHYRELEEEEMYEPTLSFYMALLFKNLVGDRVLNIEMEPDQAILFGHCTSLHHKSVPGAVTLFGVNMDDDPARFSLKLSKREDGGDIMQFILGHDHSGNIVVNGRPMYYEGDIKPVVKRVRPYKTLLINLPAKSFGFWVLANTKIEACHDVNLINKTFTEEENVSENLRVKRSMNDDFEDTSNLADLSYDFEDTDTITTGNTALKSRIIDINRDLDKIHSIFKTNKGRFKREDDDTSYSHKRLRRQRLRNKFDRNNFDLDLDPKRLIGDILQKAKHSVDVLKSKGLREVKRKLTRSKINKRQSRNSGLKTIKPLKYKNTDSIEMIPRKRINMNKIRPIVKSSNLLKAKKRYHQNNTPKNNIQKSLNVNEISKNAVTNEEKLSIKDSIENEILKEDHVNFEPKIRKRRHLNKETEELSTEKDADEKQKDKMWKIFKEIHKDLKDTSRETEGKEDKDESQEGIVLKTELSDDTATIKVTDAGKGVIKSTMKRMANVLEDLNKNLNRFWGALSLLD